MSTFLGLIEEIPGILVDCFNQNFEEYSIYFLSHCHLDHMKGLENQFFRHLQKSNKYLYCSSITKAFLTSKYCEDVKDVKDVIKDIIVDKEIFIKYKYKDNTNHLSVTCISAGHCPGSVMFLFKKTDKLVLYTGDFRINPKDYKKINPLHFRRDSNSFPKKLTKIYLDTTFLNSEYEFFPTRIESINMMYKVIQNWLDDSPKNVVVLECSALYGSEFLYMELSKLLKIPIHVKEFVFKNYYCISEIKEYITDDPNTRIHACMNKRNRSNLMCRNNILEENILTIVPSALRWKIKKQDVVEEWHCKRKKTFNVCYSMHASFDELKNFIQYFESETIYPCVCPKGLEHKIYSLLDEIKTKIKKEENNVENYSLNIAKGAEVVNKQWTKYYLSNSDEDNF